MTVTGVTPTPTETVAQALGASGTAATSPSSSSSSTSSTTDSGQLDSQTFLKLLVAQLKYQNPDSPTDPSQFLTQTATFTQVQSLQSMQTSMSTLLAAQQQTQAATMLGRTVTWSDTSSGTAVTRSGVVTAVQPDPSGSSGPTLSVTAPGATTPSSVALSAIEQVTETPTTTG